MGQAYIGLNLKGVPLNHGFIDFVQPTDNGNGTITIPTMKAQINDAADFKGNIKTFTIAGVTTTNGGALDLVDAAVTPGAMNYLCVNYNSGSPIWTIQSTTVNVNNGQIIPYISLYREGNVLNWIDWQNQGIGTADKLTDRMIRTERIKYETGLEVATNGSKEVQIQPGYTWHGTVRKLHPIFNYGDSIKRWYRTAPTVWATDTITTYENLFYNDPSVGLVGMNPNKFVVNWLYRSAGVVDKAVIILGLEYGSYAEAAAELEPLRPPSNQNLGILIARIIVKYNNTSPTILSAFTNPIGATAASDHEQLGGILGGDGVNNHYHVAYFDTIAAAQAITSWVDNSSIIYIRDLNDMFVYKSNPGLTADGVFILTTGVGGTSRFVSIQNAGIRFSGGVTFQFGTVDPSAVATSAFKGSLYFKTDTPKMFYKTDDGSSTNWTLMNDHETLSSLSGGSTSNHYHFAEINTVANARLLPGGSNQILFVDETCLWYRWEAVRSQADDGLIILNTATAGTTRWTAINRIQGGTGGDTGWVIPANYSEGVLTPITALVQVGKVVRLTVTATNAVYGINGKRVELVPGNYDCDFSPAGVDAAIGTYFISFSDTTGVLTRSTSFFDFRTQVPVAVQTWTGSAFVGQPLTEFHGIRDTVWHEWAHDLIGCKYKSGLQFTSGTIQPDNNTNPGALETTQFLWSTAGIIVDEDAYILSGSAGTLWAQTLGSGLTSATAAVFPFMRYDGTSIITVAANANREPFLFTGANGTPERNNGGSLTAAVTGDYVVYHYFAGNMANGYSVFARPHNNTAAYTTLASAQSARPSSLVWQGFPVAEVKHLYTAIWRVNTTWTPTHRCKLVSFQDFRQEAGSPVSGISATDHQTLSNRNAVAAHPATSIDYPPTTATDWDVATDPVNVQEGLDKIASQGIAKTQTANTLFAGPTSGGAALPTFRTIVNADVPTNTLSLSKLANGSAGGITHINASGVHADLPGNPNATAKFLRSTGDGVNAQAPTLEFVDAGVTTYTPGTAANWSSTPAAVSTALDTLSSDFSYSMKNKITEELKNYVPSLLSNFGAAAVNATTLSGLTITNGTVVVCGVGCTDTQQMMGLKCLKIVGAAGNNAVFEFVLDAIDVFEVGKPVYYRVKIKNNSATYTTGNLTLSIAVVGGAVLPETTISIPAGDYEAKGFFLPTSSAAGFYSIRVVQSGSNGVADAPYIDDLFVGPEKNIYANAVTDPQPITLTLGGFGSAPGQSCEYIRVGKKMFLKGTIAAGGTGFSGAFFTLPAGLTGSFDNNTIGIINTNAYQVVGTFLYVGSNPANTRVRGNILRSNTSNVSFIFTTSNSSSGNLLLSFADVAATFGGVTMTGGDTISIDMSLDITEWSSNVQVADTSLVRSIVRYVFTPAATITLASGVETLLPYDYEIIDTKKEVTTGAAWKFTAKTSGYYRVHAQAMLNLSDTSVELNERWDLSVWVNGAYYSIISTVSRLAEDIQYPINQGSCIVKLAAGGYVQVFGNHNIAANVNVYTPAIASNIGAIEIEQIPFSDGLAAFPIGSRNIIADSTGTAVPAGYIGEQFSTIISGSGVAIGTTDYTTSAALPVPIGTWFIFLLCNTAGNASVTGLEIGISTDVVGTTFADRDLLTNMLKIGISSGYGGSGQLTLYYTSSTTTNIYAKFKATGTTENVYYKMKAVRIA